MMSAYRSDVCWRDKFFSHNAIADLRSFIYDLKTKNMSLTDKRKLEAQREREAQEKVKNISSNVPVIGSVCWSCGNPVKYHENGKPHWHCECGAEEPANISA